jgi:hypothetical protein
MCAAAFHRRLRARVANGCAALPSQYMLPVLGREAAKARSSEIELPGSERIFNL